MSLHAVCAQRLLRRLCKDCREAYTPDSARRLQVGAPDRGPVTLYRARGCQKCSGTGYRGRIGMEAFSRSVLGSATSDLLAIWREPYTDGRALAAEAIDIVRGAVAAAVSRGRTAS